MLDKDTREFRRKMFDVVEKVYNANCDTEEAEEFVIYVFEHYKLSGLPKKINEWLKDFLKDWYQYVDKPPVWVEEEPNWPYSNGKPMIFIKQFTIPKTPITEEKLTWDNTIYVFGERIPYKSSYKVEYKIIEQIGGIDGNGDR